jgi:hypothetical protein
MIRHNPKNLSSDIVMRKEQEEEKRWSLLFVVIAAVALHQVPVKVLVTIQVRLCPGLGAVLLLHSGE